VDDGWYRDVNDFARQTPWLHGVLAAYALWAGLVVLVAILTGVWWTARRRSDAPRAVSRAVLTGVAAVVALLINQKLISPAIARVRPCHTMSHVEVLLTCGNDYSMPSDHCIIAGALAAGLWILRRWVGALATALALVLAFSRVYVGVHYPSDTIVGLAIGAGIALMLIAGLQRPTEALARRLARGPLRRLITSSAISSAETTTKSRSRL
jgi:undecaprenyl-diphosphatase